MTRSRQARARSRARSITKSVEKPRLRLDQFLPHRLSVLSNTVSRAIAGDYAERFGLSIPEWRVIAVLQYFPGASSGELTEKTGMDSVAVSRAVNQLVRAGLITRRTSSMDRRRTVLDLSEQGQEVYDEITPLALRYESLLLEDLTQRERIQLDKLLTKLLKQAQTLRRDS
jgi:DNA-binding MarR family transcriptional regulator